MERLKLKTLLLIEDKECFLRAGVHSFTMQRAVATAGEGLIWV